MFGRMLKQHAPRGLIYGVMMMLFVGMVGWAIYWDTLQPNPGLTSSRQSPEGNQIACRRRAERRWPRRYAGSLAGLPVDQELGNLEGKELRFGTSAGATFAAVTTAVTCGSVNCMHDSLNPLAGLTPLDRHVAQLRLRRQGRRADQPAGLPDRRRLPGRADGGPDAGVPGQEGRGPRDETGHARPADPPHHDPRCRPACSPPAIGARRRPITPGRTASREILYEFSSASANNGSGFEGLADTWGFNDKPRTRRRRRTARHWDIATGLVMLLGRFIPILAPLALAASLAAKKPTPFTAGTLRTDTLTFGFVLLGTILLVGRCCSCRRRCWGRSPSTWGRSVRRLVSRTSRLFASSRLALRMKSRLRQAKPWRVDESWRP